MNAYAEPQQKRAAKPAASGMTSVAGDTRAALRRADGGPRSGEQQALQDAYDNSPRVQAQRRLGRSLNDGPRAAERARLAMSLSGPARAPHHASAVQRQANDGGGGEGSLVTPTKCESVAHCGEEDGGELERLPVQRQPEPAGAARAGGAGGGAGLPAGLRAGVEALAGVPMGDVEVEYNSPEPAKMNALATTQGRRIRLAPGREQDLPHEAWHAAQQKQGRVRATARLKNTPLNDDAALEREADRMGARAGREGERVLQGKAADGGLGACAPASCSAQAAPVQRLLKDDESDTVETPTSAIMKSFGVYKNQLSGFARQVPATPTKRAKKVSATVQKSTLRADERKNKGTLSNVTSMARAEQLILQGADMLKFYDAGHLVADQLVGGDKGTDSFAIWNLAAQVASLNEHTYTSVAEDEVREAADKGATVDLKVRVAYPADHYTVKRREIIRRGILTAVPLDTPTTKWQIAGKEFKDADLDKGINIPRRVPNIWKMTALITTPLTKFPEKEKEAGKGGPAEKFVPDLSAPQEQPTIGDPFRFLVKGATLANQKLKLPESEKRSFRSRQWWSPTDVPNEDIISLVKSTFADIESGKVILERLKGTDILVAVQQKDALLSAVTETLNPQRELTDLAIGIGGLPDELWSLRDGYDRAAVTLAQLSEVVPGKAEAADENRQIREAIDAKRLTVTKLQDKIKEVSKAYPPRIAGFIQTATLAQDPVDIVKSVFNAQTAAHELEKNELAPLKEELKALSEEVAALKSRQFNLDEKLRQLKEEEARLAQEEETRRQLAATASTEDEEEEVEESQLEEDWESDDFLREFLSTTTTTTTLSASMTQPTPQYNPGGQSSSAFDLFTSFGTQTIGGLTSSGKLKRSRGILEEEEEESSSQSEKRHEPQKLSLSTGFDVTPTGGVVDLKQTQFTLGTSEDGNYVRVDWLGLIPPAWVGDRIDLGFMVVTVRSLAYEDGAFYLYY